MSTPPLVDADDVHAAIEYYAERGWTDGLPVVPVTESYLARFLEQTSRDPDDVVFEMPHLDRRCTVRTAAINAALAGCRPEYLPTVLAAWDAFVVDGYPRKGIWQSTTGTAPFLILNGPVRARLDVNCRGNVFGSGFRANATIARAIRLTAINCFGLRPHELDQATQATPAKYTACIGENEEDSPWPPFHVDQGHDAEQSTVTAMVIRSVIHVEARHTVDAEQLARDLCNTLARTGALIHETISGVFVLGPEHAAVFANAGWDKAELRRYSYEHAPTSRDALAAVGKETVSSTTRWRLPRAHPEAVPDTHEHEGRAGDVRVLNSPEALQVVVAGAANAGVSAVVESFGPRGGPPACAVIESPTEEDAT